MNNFHQVVEEVKKVPKSKTWFLGGRMAKAKAKGSKSRRRSTLALEAAAALEVAAEDEPAVKREPKPADPLVFLGSEDIVLDDKFELKTPAATVGLDDLRSRVSSGLGAVSGIMAKLSGLAEPEKESTSIKELEKKPEVEAKEAKKFPDLGPVIATEEVEEYSDKVSHGSHNLGSFTRIDR